MYNKDDIRVYGNIILKQKFYETEHERKYDFSMLNY